MRDNTNQHFFDSLIGGVIGFIVGLMFCHSVLNFIAFAITGFYFMKLIHDLGNTIPIDGFILSLASMQWLLGPALAYSGYSHHFKYYMYVPEETYYPFAIGGVVILHISISLLFKRNSIINLEGIEVKIREQLQSQPLLPYYLIGIGLISSVLMEFTPDSIRFFMGLLGNVSYIGVIYLLFSNTTFRWGGILGLIGLLFVGAISNGLFHDLLLWLSFVAFYIAKINKFSLRTKLIYVTAGLGLALLIQLVKAEFRNYVWYGDYGGNKVSLFIELASKELISDDPDNYYNDQTEGVVVRLNQGWIISRIMYHIPMEEDYLHGQSIKSALYAGITPRFVDPTKQTAGGQDYFERFTGFELNNASMGASLLGEGYANFGVTGGLIFLFIYGLFIGWVLKLIFKLSLNHPTLMLWLPFLFLQVVKAESDLLRVFNHLTKAAVVLYLLYWFLGKQLKWKI